MLPSWSGPHRYLTTARTLTFAARARQLYANLALRPPFFPRPRARWESNSWTRAIECGLRSALGKTLGRVVSILNLCHIGKTCPATLARLTSILDIEILRGRLAEILYKRSKAISEYVKKERGTEVEYIFGDYLDSIEQDDQKVHVQFAKSGEKRDFDIVVGADGLQSRTRRMVFGDEDPVKRLGMYAGFFSMPKGETDSKWRRWYHAPGRRGIMVRPSHLDDMSTVLVSVINDNDSRLPEAAKKGHQGVEEQKALLKEYFQDAGWESDRMIREMEAADDFYYDVGVHACVLESSKADVSSDGGPGQASDMVKGACGITGRRWVSTTTRS